MIIEKVNEKDLKRKDKKKFKELDSIVSNFLKTDFNCVKVIDDSNHYNNNNDLCSGFRSVIKKNFSSSCKVFMLNGYVYLKRK